MGIYRIEYKNIQRVAVTICFENNCNMSDYARRKLVSDAVNRGEFEVYVEDSYIGLDSLELDEVDSDPDSVIRTDGTLISIV